jgi:hypothetical protein
MCNLSTNFLPEDLEPSSSVSFKYFLFPFGLQLCGFLSSCSKPHFLEFSSTLPFPLLKKSRASFHLCPKLASQQQQNQNWKTFFQENTTIHFNTSNLPNEISYWTPQRATKLSQHPDISLALSAQAIEGGRRLIRWNVRNKEDELFLGITDNPDELLRFVIFFHREKFGSF